ncbi:MAG TPA: FKBP-type peptidyl-prolyl cis-trans isomerase [Thermoanaerobaculia bacterium]|nr:FKBP-type peptidyl-prolyl cis-trans isomerase [Thermoanaerobaculia bacterium]
MATHLPALSLLLVALATLPLHATDPPAAPPDVAAVPADAAVTASGLASRLLAPGTGTEQPRAGDQVKVHYSGWTADGKLFDSSVARGKPAVLPLDRLIPGWQEGLALMVEGEKRRLWIPARLAYEGKPEKPQGMLVFDVELLDILRLPPVPADVAAPPAGAERSKSGLAWQVLKPGTGTRRPSKRSRVEVHYTGWTTDGKMFDSSISRGAPSSFGLDQVIEGWTEGLQLMVEGEIRRFWIPKKLAYRGQPGYPEGLLVFEVELIQVLSSPAP